MARLDASNVPVVGRPTLGVGGKDDNRVIGHRPREVRPSVGHNDVRGLAGIVEIDWPVSDVRVAELNCLDRPA